MAREYKVSSRLPSLLTVEDDLVEAEVLSESMIGGDDDTKLRLSSRNTLGHKRNRNRTLSKHVEMCGRTREVVVKQNEENRKMAESFSMARAHGVSEARVHGVPCARGPDGPCARGPRGADEQLWIRGETRL